MENTNDILKVIDVSAALRIQSLREQINEEDNLPLNAIFASDLGKYEPPVELVEGLINDITLSVMYGDSNCGKTFLAIDMACSISRGIDWMGRRTTKGLVVYLATESPISAKNRLIAYKNKYGVELENFLIVRSPVDFYSGDLNANEVINLVEKIEFEKNQKVRLIVGDTLARISAGANENTGQDMSIVIKRVEQVMNECKCHFMLIHHTGKNNSAGARGWSGLKCAIDTEIEVVASVEGRYFDDHKQRDKEKNLRRFGFKLEPVYLGVNQWGDETSGCVVISCEAPKRQSREKINETGGAILEFLRGQPAALRRNQVTDHFKGFKDRSTISKQMDTLIEKGLINQSIGMVSYSTNNNLDGAN